jgi:hypothetical protein
MLETFVSVVAVAVLAVVPFALLGAVARLFGVDSWGEIADDRPR